MIIKVPAFRILCMLSIMTALDIGNTPLHLALLENEEAIAMELVQAGADYLTAINHEGKTCLDLAGQALKDALPRNTI